MQKSLVAVATAVSSALMPVQPAMTHTNPEIIEVQQPNTIEDLIVQKARENNLNAKKVLFIAKCESQLEAQAVGDNHLLCKRTGEPMRSRGIWQINDCGHPEVSSAQAFDPNWSTDWAIEIFKKGRESREWVTCTDKYNASLLKSQVAKK